MRRRTDDATATLELVFVTPVILMILMLMFAFGRFSQSESIVDQAARDSARSATAQNDSSAVGSVTDRVTKEAMDDAPSSCRDSAKATFTETANAFELPDIDNLDQVEAVTVTVTCRLDMGDLMALPLKTVTITRTFTSPLDRYRGYQ